MLELFQYIAKSTPLLMVALVLESLSCVAMTQKYNYANDNFDMGMTPDVWFGYDENDIYEWMEKIGPNGRMSYVEIMKWDFVPYMPSYTILLGSVLAWQCEIASDWNSNVALIAPLIMIFDLVETASNYFITTHFPLRAKYIVMVSSLANQLKWITCAVGILVLVILIIQNYFLQKRKRRMKIE